MKINDRLKMIGDLVEANSFCLDVGCDHAFLDIYLVKRKDNIILTKILKYIITSKKKYLICSIISFLVMIMCIARSCWVAFVIYFLMIVIYVIIKKDKKCCGRY